MSSSVNDWQNSIGKWQYHLDYIWQSDSLSDSEKTEVLDGIAKLREVFNDDWLWQAVKIRHPLLSYITNYAPGSLFWLSDFGRRLDLIKNVDKFDELEKRLRNVNEYAGAEAEVNSAYKLKATGLDIELFPKVGTQKADIKTFINGEEVYFEVASLQDSMKSVRASETHQSLTFPYTFNHEVIIQCQIHKILSRPRIKEMQAKIEKAIAEVKETKKFAYIGESRVIDYLVVHRSRQEELDELVSSFGMKREISGPPILRDDVRRLEAKLWEEIKQLPKDKPGAIVIYCSLIYFGDAKDYYNELIYEVEEAIYDHANLVLGVIVNNVGTSEKGTFLQEPNYVLAIKPLHNILRETVLIIQNRYSDFASKDKLIKKVIAAFTSNP